MSGKFNQRVHDSSGAEYVTLDGVIDEDNELISLADKLDAKDSSVVVLLLARVERVNDVGARAFSVFLDTLAERSARLVLVECSPAVVSQLNQLGDVGKRLIVKSFAAPYFCPECDEPRTVWCEAVDFDGPPSSVPVKRCEECDYVMQFDDEADSYFSFLATRSERIDPTLEDQISEHLLSRSDELTTAPGRGPELDSIPQAPRRAPTAPHVEGAAGPPLWVVLAIIVAAAIGLAVFAFS